jgi:hypothetical protein
LAPGPARAVRANLSAVGFHEVPHDRQTETQAAMLAGRQVIGLAKPLEDEREKRRRDALTAVSHGQLEGAGAAEADPHASAVGCELDGIRQKIHENLLEPCRISGELRDGIARVHGEVEVLRIGGRLYDVDTTAHDGS